MASEKSDSEDLTEGSHGPRECMPCRGSGRVISNLGGVASTVPCPWCAGGGVRLAESDAQARWLDGEGPAAAGVEASPEPAEDPQA
ncbi:MAG: hypothetical protein ABSG95_04625 [Solirubrobacteraceae bacterium]